VLAARGLGVQKSLERGLSVYHNSSNRVSNTGQNHASLSLIRFQTLWIALIAYIALQ
jgi:hypothetical protein